jgi:endonuclease/exonuclease/phosphatase (EEP) superfamily protein YafD
MGFSLRYAPSMRNGVHRSDRGNAILANVALEGTHAFLLPYVRQRRVAITTHLAGLPDLVLASAHLDTGGAPPGAWPVRYGAGRLVQAAELAHRLIDPQHEASVVLGADLNSPLGMRDPVVRALLEGGLQPARRVGRWRHTYHAGVRLPLDYVLYRSPTGRVREVSVERIDEAPGDRTPRVFGSDHHPLFARVELVESADSHAMDAAG